MRTFDSKDKLFGIIDSLISRIEKKNVSMCVIIHRGYSLGGNPVLGGRLEHNSVFVEGLTWLLFLIFQEVNLLQPP